MCHNNNLPSPLERLGDIAHSSRFYLSHEVHEAVSQKDHTLKCFRTNCCKNVFPKKKKKSTELKNLNSGLFNKSAKY